MEHSFSLWQMLERWKISSYAICVYEPTLLKTGETAAGIRSLREWKEDKPQVKMPISLKYTKVLWKKWMRKRYDKDSDEFINYLRM